MSEKSPRGAESFSPAGGTGSHESGQPLADGHELDGVCTDNFWADCRRNFWAALKSSSTNIYFYANCVYVCYASGMMWIDYTAYPNEVTATNQFYNDIFTNSTSNSTFPFPVSTLNNDVNNINFWTSLVNNEYIGWGVIHVINSWMYVFVWVALGYKPCTFGELMIFIPEFLNVIGAFLYLGTACVYYRLTTAGPFDWITMVVHKSELTASVIETFAAFGWVLSWYLTYPRGVGQGWSLNDPDMWANIFIVVPALVYLAYNIQIMMDPTQYGSDMLYVMGDVLYFIGSIWYLLGAMRDDGWFWFMPSDGVLPYGLDAIMPLPPKIVHGRAAMVAAIEHAKAEREATLAHHLPLQSPPPQLHDKQVELTVVSPAPPGPSILSESASAVTSAIPNPVATSSS